MRIALVLGLQQGNTIKPRLQGIKDNLDIDIFDSVGLFIDSSLKRNAIYDRIVLLSTKVDEVCLSDLYNYWSATSKDTAIVMLCKKGTDELKATTFLETFRTPVASAMLLQSTTVNIIAEAVLRPTNELTNDYGIKDFMGAEVDEDVYVQPEEKPKTDDKKSKKQKEPREKRSLAGALFGGKKKKAKVQEQQQLQIPQSDSNQQQSQQAQFMPQQEQYSAESFNQGQSQFNNTFSQNSQHQFGQAAQQQFVQESQQQFNNDFQNVSDDFSQVQAGQEFEGQEFGIQQDSQYEQFSQQSPQFEQQTYVQEQQFSSQGEVQQYNTDSVDNSQQGYYDESLEQVQNNGYIQNYSQNSQIGDTEEIFDNSSQYYQSDSQVHNSGYDDLASGNTYQDTQSYSEQQYETPVSKVSLDKRPVENLNINTQQSSSQGVSSNFNGFQQQPFQSEAGVVNDFEPEVSGDVDFGSNVVTYESTSSQQNNMNAATVDVSFDDTSIGNAEAQYRQKNDVRVVKEVIRETAQSSGTANILQGVLSGRLRKVILVTGDRGSGITSTAFNIAQYLARNVGVLYFDCDTDNHGLLNYIDYSQFVSYEDTRRNGIHYCRTLKAFDNCVINWGSTLDILTSDFTCDVSDDDLKQAQDVVAEKSTDYNVVVVDCPMSKLQLMPDLLLVAETIVCVEGTKRGFMNMLCGLESNTMSLRYKRNLVARGKLFITKCTKNLDLKKLLRYIRDFYEPDGVDWLAMQLYQFDGRLNDVLINNVLEG